MEFQSSQEILPNRLPKPTNFSNIRAASQFQEQFKKVQSQSNLNQVSKKPSFLRSNQLKEEQKEIVSKSGDNGIQGFKHENFIDLRSKEAKRPMMHQGDNPPEQQDLNLNINFKQIQARSFQQTSQNEKKAQEGKQLSYQCIVEKDLVKYSKTNFKQIINEFEEQTQNDTFEIQCFSQKENLIQSLIDSDKNNEGQSNLYRTSSTNNTNENTQNSQLNEYENQQQIPQSNKKEQQNMEKSVIQQSQKQLVGKSQSCQNVQSQKQQKQNIQKQTINLEQVQLLEEKLAGMLEGLKMNASASIFSDEW